MTYEEREIRKAISQILADTGVNRETIIKMVNDVISEKVTKAVDNLFNGGMMDSKINPIITEEVRSVISEKVRSSMRQITVTTTVQQPTLQDREVALKEAQKQSVRQEVIEFLEKHKNDSLLSGCINKDFERELVDATINTREALYSENDIYDAALSIINTNKNK